MTAREASARRMWPLYAAGFTTAFGAHGIAASLGARSVMIGGLFAFALASATPAGRLGQTMGAAELGRELGDAGGPLLVAAVATLTTLTHGYAALAVLLVTGPVVGLVRRASRAS